MEKSIECKGVAKQGKKSDTNHCKFTPFVSKIANKRELDVLRIFGLING